MNPFEIVDLNENNFYHYLRCLKTWDKCFYSERKLNWYRVKKNKGLRVKLAVNRKNSIMGMIQYLPGEESFIRGDNIYLIQCIWVNGYDKGIGNVQNLGVGKNLVKEAEIDIFNKNSDDLAAWGMTFEEWMPVSWFKSLGYSEVERKGEKVLVWKKFNEKSAGPRFLTPLKKPKKTEGKVTATVFNDGWCQDLNIEADMVKTIVDDYGINVSYTEIDTSDKKVMHEWGIDNGIFIDDMRLLSGPSFTEKAVREHLEMLLVRLNNG